MPLRNWNVCGCDWVLIGDFYGLKDREPKREGEGEKEGDNRNDNQLNNNCSIRWHLFFRGGFLLQVK